MNKILIFFLITTNLASCYSQKETYNVNKINMYIKDYNSKLEKLDRSVVSQFSSLSKMNKDDLPKEIIFPFKKRSLKIQKSDKIYYLRQYDKTDKNSVELEFELTPGGNIYFKEKIDKLFYYSEIYYANGYIQVKGISSWLGFAINKGYKYGKEGNLIETIDYDEGYDFNYQNVLEFCVENKIKLLDNQMNRLKKVTIESGRKVWNIEYFNPETNKIDFYQLDGNTGEIIQKELGKEKYGIKHYEK
jgi:hypothetical protein